MPTALIGDAMKARYLVYLGAAGLIPAALSGNMALIVLMGCLIWLPVIVCGMTGSEL